MKCMPGDFREKFFERIDKTSDPQGCWLWTRCKTSQGYGNVWYNGKMEKTHKVAYLLSGKTIPEGHELAHSGLCVGKKHCCNPDHLTPKTRSDNCKDKWRDGTMVYKITDSQVLEIRTRVDKNQSELAKEYGVSFQLISAIRKNKNRKRSSL